MSEVSFPALQLSSLRANVADLLRNALLEGRYRPGEDLSDSGLAREFNVSRGPVREALLILAEEGLLVHQHYRGFKVPSFSTGDISQIIEARRPLEVLALHLARTHATPADIAELVALKETLLDTFVRKGMAHCTLPDYNFHARIWALSGNPWILTALRRLTMPYFVYVAAFRMERHDHSRELMEEMHLRYIEYVAGRSAESAESCVDFHLSL